MTMAWRELPLVDPIDRSPLIFDGTDLVSGSGRRYGFVEDQPNLLPPHGIELGGWRFPPVVVDDAQRPRPTRRSRRFGGRVKRWLQPAGDRADAVRALHHRLADVDGQSDLLVVGGASEGEGLASLLGDRSIRVTAFDIYPTPQTTLIADAHRIPLADESIDAVIVQAVLEHVYRPAVVVAEIRRVLRPGGLVYAETPFLQPVHEGAYDFTRFTVSGHRLLMEGFESLASGPIGGPGALMNLAIRGLVGGVTRSASAAKVAYAVTLPLRTVDRLVPARWRADFAVGAYFLGRCGPSAEAVAFDAAAVHATDGSLSGSLAAPDFAS